MLPDLVRCPHISIALSSVTFARTDSGTAKNSKKEKAPCTTESVPAAIEVESDIVYKTVGGEKLSLDLYRVKGRKYDQAPLVIWIHGGGFRKGDKTGAVKHNAGLMVPLLMEHGYLVASFNYHFVEIKGPKLVNCMTDCLDAVRFLVKNSARFGLDPERMVTIGSSAGGGLALVVAMPQDGDRPLLPEQAIETEHCSHARVADNKVGHGQL